MSVPLDDEMDVVVTAAPPSTDDNTNNNSNNANMEEVDLKPLPPVMPSTMAGIEGGAEPPARSSGFFGGLASFFREFTEEISISSAQIADATQGVTDAGQDCVERVEQFKRVAADYVRLQELSARLMTALHNVAESHKAFAERLQKQAKEFADAAAKGGGKSLEDGFAGPVHLDSPKKGDEADVLSRSAQMHHELAEAVLNLQKTTAEFAGSVSLFKEKVIGDLNASVKLYKRNRLLLDACQRRIAASTTPNAPSPDKDALPGLQAAHDKSKEAVDVKLAFLVEKRKSDMKAIVAAMLDAMKAYIKQTALAATI